MKQVIARAGKVEVAEVPRPACGRNGVLVKTLFSVISTGTESWAIGSTEPLGTGEVLRSSSLAEKAVRLGGDVLRQEGVAGLRDYVGAVRHPTLPLGYSSSGVVVEVGQGVVDLVPGDQVACAGEGWATHSEFAFVPRRLAAKVPAGVALRDASFSTLGAIALHAVRTARPQLGEAVGVIGVGLVGNLVAQLARAAGCRVVCLDMRDDRLRLAESLGIGLALRSDDPSLESHVSDFTAGVGLDSVFVCAASETSAPLNAAARLARSRGTVTVVGRVGMDIERKDMYQKEIRLLMSRSLGPGRYDPQYEEKGIDYPLEYVRWTLNRNMGSFMALVGDGRVRLGDLVGGTFPVASAVEAYAALESQSKTAVLLTYGEGAPPAPEKPRQAVAPKAAAGRPIKVALVGPGAFAKETMIPLLRSSPEYRLGWVVSSNPVRAKQVQGRYRFERSTCDYSEALADPEVGLVVITAPNDLHSEMLAQAMKAGKLALLEKPLCVTRGEFDQLKALQASAGLPVVVGFNRRYAPLVVEMRERMKRMDGPFVVTYRVNAGFVPASKWSQDPDKGGGRIVHECCHFFDFFNFLLGPGEPRVTVELAGVTGANSVARDNLSVSLRYPGGSLATLTYVAMGSKSMDRERVEVYGEKSSMVLDDFRTLAVYGDRKRLTKLPAQDKGHRNELLQLARMARGLASSVITTEEVFSATELTFRVEEAARGAGPS